MKELPGLRRCWAEIDLGALQRNVAALRARAVTPIRLMAVVKANAYGHGMLRVAEALQDRVEMFGVANVSEAAALRQHLPQSEIFILGPVLPFERAAVVAGKFIPAISTVEEARAYNSLASGRPIPIHVAVDTGMGRMGIWQDDALAAINEIGKLPAIEISGIGTHLPVADEDDAFTSAQLDRFYELVGAIREQGLTAIVDHAANSAAVMGFPTRTGEMVRAGLALYGSAPRPEFQSTLAPVLTWKACVTLVRAVGAGRGISYGRAFITTSAMRVATLGVGYADGYQRHLSLRNAEVLIRGRRCSVLGRVTMDQIMADVSTLPDCAAGDEAVLIGRQGSETILAAELAAKAGTIAWEIFTGIGSRVERFYV